jgi:HopA1 effector protein family
VTVAVGTARSVHSVPEPVRAALLRVASSLHPTPSGWVVGGAAHDDTALAEGLYAGWYTLAPSSVTSAGDPPARRGSMVAALRAAHTDAGLTDDQWVVVQASPGGRLVASSGERTRTLLPGEYVQVGRPGVPAAPGELVRTTGRLDAFDEERGLWWTFTAELPGPPVGRVYLDARAATAPQVVHEVTAALSGTASAWQLKCPVDPAACDRVDAMVVYHRRDERRQVLDALRARAEALAGLLDPAVPPLTCPVLPGLSWADDDGGGQRSFGETRCAVLAAAVRAARDGWDAADLDARLSVLLDGLRDAGIDPAAPWKAAAR